jgi:glycosyltransferase involved in cell wall biosynthesis
MRIAVLASSYPRFPGDGAAPFVKSIAEHMAHLGHAVEVVAPYDPAVSAPDTTRPADSVRVHRFRYIWPARLHIMGHARAMEADALEPLSLPLPLFLAAAFFALWRVTGRQKSQAIHVHWVVPNGPVAACVAALRRIPFVISLHGSDIFFARRNRLFGAVAGWVFRRAAGVTACSPELRDGALALGAREVRLLAWGADPQIFHPQRRSFAYRQAAGWAAGSQAAGQPVIVTALGRLVYKKGFDRLVTAWAGLAARQPQAHGEPSAHLVIGGDGPLRAALETQVQQLGLQGRVSFAGQIPWDQVPDFLASSDVFILPSVRDAQGNMDGLPTVLLEAMGCGLAVVASRLGGIPLVIEDGQNGLLIPPDDVPALENALETMLQPARRQALAQAARRSIEQTFNWTNVARSLAEMLAQAVSQRETAGPRRLERPFWGRSSSHPKQATRMGSVYRDEMIRLLGRGAQDGRVLDVGCHDGLFLSTLGGAETRPALRVGVDVDIVRSPGLETAGVQFACADGCRLPFADEKFDYVYALDVIEHIPEDRSFACSLTRMIAPGGRLFLSTPSLHIRLNPPFLTGWVSRSWGHTLRLGYTAEALAEMFTQPGLQVRVRQWNAPAYRFFYLPLRALQVLLPGLVARLTRRAAQWDFKHSQGQHGFQIVEVTRPAG